MRRDVDGEQLRTLLEQGISQREIARRLGIPRSTLQEHLKRLQVSPLVTPGVYPRCYQGGHLRSTSVHTRRQSSERSPTICWKSRPGGVPAKCAGRTPVDRGRPDARRGMWTCGGSSG
jgi:Winged helix-turn-helix DNA-binding